MNTLHTWAGVALGALLYMVFWTGTLSVFDREIDRWMMPETRFQVPEAARFEPAVEYARRITPEARSWTIVLPGHREPMTVLYIAQADGSLERRFLEPVSGLPLLRTGTLGATRFIFPLHSNLLIEWRNLGAWLIGAAGMAMLVLLVSGVVIHCKLIAHFFMFRPKRKLPRATLDLHNLTGVLALPFHFTITLSGLAVFYWIYFGGVIDAVYDGDQQAFFDQAYGTYARPTSGRPGQPVALDELANRVGTMLGGPVRRIEIIHPGDHNAVIDIRPSTESQVAFNYRVRFHDAQSGALLAESDHGSVFKVISVLAGLHFVWFDHWPLRWLYFVLGLSGCVMIATGYIYWLETRRKRHARLGLPGVRIVEGLTVGAVTGIIIATLGFFIANRLLPLGAGFAGYERAALEVWAFYLVWLATFAHAWLRPGRAWREQCVAVAALALLAPVLNWVTTGDHLLKTLSEGYWPVAGLDLLLLAGAAVAAWTARKLGHRPAAAMKADSRLPGTREPQHG